MPLNAAGASVKPTVATGGRKLPDTFYVTPDGTVLTSRDQIMPVSEQPIQLPGRNARPPEPSASSFWPQDENGIRVGDRTATRAEAVRLADAKIKAFEQAVRNNQVNKSQLALELQSDPLAVQRLNQNPSADLKVAHNAATDAIKNSIREQIRADVARKYGVTPDKVNIEDMTKPRNPNDPKVGQDWDFTTKIKGQGGREIEVPVKDIRHIVDNAVNENPTVKSMKPPRSGTMTEHLAINPTDHL
ncbi:MAG: hypothetical protein NTV49_01200, partial [Kiritimatiellaeota bacterium]|nr:hypothetical protein [Kiritimatiellota bacterium]